MEMNADSLQVVQVPVWNRLGWLRHGFSTRAGGVSTVYGSEGSRNDLNLGFTRDDSVSSVRQNRERFAKAVGGLQGFALATVRQVHGTEVKVVARGESGLIDAEGRALIEADGLMTDAPGILLGIQAADCVPVLVADTRQRVVAAFHAGWRGTVAEIVREGVAAMHSQFGSRPEDLIGAVGPSIGACCYAVGDELRERFEDVFPYATELFSRRATGLHLDLVEANRRQLLDAGLSPDAVAVVDECTACTRLGDGSRKYFSHRAEHGFTGRAMGIIGIVQP